MPLRGESVGTAYIRLIADGSGIPDDIRDSLRDADGNFEDPGSAAARSYKKGFNEEMAKHDAQSLDHAISNALAKDDALAEFFSDDTRWGRVERNLHARFGSLGNAAADDLKRELARAGNLDGLEHNLENISARVNKIVDQAIADNERFDRETKARMVSFETQFRRVMEESSQVSKRVSRDNVSNLEGLRRTLERLSSGTLTKFARDLEKARIELDDDGNSAKKNGHLFSRFGVEIDNIADSVGRAFGKGSRNDFLNFTGSFIANSVKLLALPAKLIGNIQEFTTGFRAAFNESGKFFSSVAEGFKTMSKDAEGASTGLSALFEGGPVALVAGVILLGTALAGVVAVLSTVASLISGIVAALVAMASTIAFAVVGAIVPLVGLLPPLALGLGAIVAGVIGLDDKTKKMLKEAIQPLINGFKELGTVARSGFFDGLGKGLDRLGNSLKGFVPVFHAIGEALGDLTRRFENLGQKPGPLLLFNRLQTFAPKVLHDLGRIVLNLTRAFSNLFVDSIPSVNNFLDFLIRITREFRKWVANNPGPIKKFFKEAGHSAQVFGDFVGSVIDLIDVLLGQGRKVGNQIFGELSKNIKKFTDSIRPTGGKTAFDEAVGGIHQVKTSTDGIPKTNPLEDWFARGHGVAQQLGDIAVSLGQIFDALDNPQGQENLTLILDILTRLGKLAGPLGFISGLTFTAINQFITAMSLGSVGIGLTAKAIGKIGDALGHIKDIKLPNFNPLKDFFKGSGGSGGIGTLTIRPPSIEWIPNVLGKIRGFVTNVLRAFNPIPPAWRNTMGELGPAAATAATKVVNFITGIPPRLAHVAVALATQAAHWGEAILNQFKDLPSRIAGLFDNLASLILRAIGSITVPIHFSFPDSLPGGKFNPANLVLNHASGGLFSGAHFAVIGEAGPEAVVPLSGPLSNVDPSVRWLSEIARGMAPTTTSGGAGAGKTINNEWHIVTPTADSGAVANELLNRMVATAY